ncbi:MAG: Bifunctional protein PutA [Phycisphaerae bacterium]|nr:Bifunctional protein PutA [Phycisphaerae bacterium]
MTSAREIGANVERRIAALGEEIFERAAAAQAAFPAQAWWMEQATRLVDADPRFKAAVFQFVDCLPVLRSDAEISRHLHEYLAASGAAIPGAALWALRGAACGGRTSRLIGACARVGARMMAGRFITGHDAESVRATLERLRRERMTFTLDVLGESTTSDARADAYVGVFHDALERLCPVARDWPGVAILDETEFGPQPRVNISIKLTGMDPHFDPATPETSIESAARRLRPLLRQARRLGAFVNIDIESTKHRALTFDLFESVMSEPQFRDFSDVGIVVQAYLRDGEGDLERMLDYARRRETRFAVRLVKGAYWDSETAAAVRNHATPPVWTQKWESDACYERMARAMLRERALIRPCFASHNVRTIAAVMAWAEQLGVPIEGYECQMLYGMGDPLKAAVAGMGRCLRVYAPYGDMLPGMAYLIRRLLENTSNDSFLKQGFADRARYAERLADPAARRPRSSPLPRLRYASPPNELERHMPTFRQTARIGFSTEEARERMRAAIARVRKGFSADGGDHSDPPAASASLAADAVRVDLEAARLARGGEAWRRTAVEERCARLARWADGVEAERYAVAAALVVHCGMLWREADAEVAQAVDYIRFHGACMSGLDAHPRRRGVPGEDNVVRYASRGLTAVFNGAGSPLACAAAGMSAALAAGNAVLVLPEAEAAPGLNLLAEEGRRAGLPAEVTAVIAPASDAVRDHAARHTDVRVVAVFAEADLCMRLRAACLGDGAPASSRRVFIAEGWGPNPMLVDDDADLDAALTGVMASGLAYCGQKRDAATRLYVVEGICDAFCGRLGEALSSLRVGNPEDPATHVGPLRSIAAATAVRARLDAARAAGRLIYEVRAPDGPSERNVAPAIVAADPGASRHAARAAGPVLEVARCANVSEAIRRVNAEGGALVGGLYSRSPAHIGLARETLEVGALFINRPTVGGEVDRHPVGGPAAWGAGIRVGDASLVEAMLVPRTISENTLRHGFSPEPASDAGSPVRNVLQPA